MTSKTIGVLALQGAFQKHIDILQSLGYKTQPVRRRDELKRCSALIIPGGESTTMTHLLRTGNLVDALKSFAAEYPVMGTCAGMILMSSTATGHDVEALQIMDFEVQRNIYGTQRESFSSNLHLNVDPEGPPFRAMFIRAPGVTQLSHEITVLARHQEQPVLIAQGHHLAASFHPELTPDNRIHDYWLKRFHQ